MAENTYITPQEESPKKKKASAKKKKPSSGSSFDFLNDSRLRLALGWFLMIFSAWMLIAFFSYLVTGQTDQSLQDTNQSLAELGDNTQNTSGSFGASLAYLLIFRWFGIGTILLAPIIGAYGYQIIFDKEIPLLKRITKFSIFAVLWLSILLGYIVLTSDTISSLDFLCGGWGFAIAQFVNQLAGIGTILLLLLVLGIFFIYFFDITSLVGLNKSKKIVDDLQENDEKQEEFIVDEAEPIIKTEAPISSEPIITPIQSKTEEETPSSIEFEVPELKKKPPITASPSLEIETPVEETLAEANKAADFEIDEGVVEEESDETTVENYDPTLELSMYKMPPVDLLLERDTGGAKVTKEELELNKDKIVETLGYYKIGIQSIKATVGPTVTLYEIVPDAGVKISKIKNLEDDIAMSLAALGIRIIAPIPGKGTIGIEVPNQHKEIVPARNVFSTEKFMKSDLDLPIAFGKTISNEVFMVDLAKMPHMLIAGATGQGKSVGINMILASLLYKKHPAELKLVLVDPKVVELSIYEKIENHYLAMLPDGEDAILTDTSKVINTLNSLCIEMEDRYNLLKMATCRNLKEYNGKFVRRKLNPNNGHRFLPYIVVVIDEYGDFIMTAGKEVETPIARLAQKARAIGIHLILATQRPDAKIVTGIIRANFPARVAFKVSSSIDSRVVLDSKGADQLIGRGDMLFSQSSDMVRVQCAFIDTPEVEALVNHISEQPSFGHPYLLPEFVGENESSLGDINLNDRDTLFEEAARIIVAHQQGSTSLVQRKLRIGYNRAGSIIDQLEAAGVVGPFSGSKAREVLLQDDYSLEQLLDNLNGIKE